jgi:hypothetical protein
MPKKTPELITALRETAVKLRTAKDYEWGHMARCNCGHLVQTITRKSDKEIVRMVEFQLDEWTEYARNICAGTSRTAENLFLALRDVGFDYDDVVHLEYLSDQRVLSHMGNHRIWRHNDPLDVSEYMETLAEMLEDDLI